MAEPHKNMPLLTLGALGVVFGDIGTSTLYAFRQCFQDFPEFAKDPSTIIGVLSLVLWALILIVCVKYLTFITRADHGGEGGTLALLGLIRAKLPQSPYAAPGALTLLVLFGSALLYGDGIITPSISVLSSVEGLNVASDFFQPYVVPIALVILVALFLVQSGGTERVGKLFGPVMVLWFAANALLGLVAIAAHPSVLAAFNPLAGIGLLFGHGWAGYLILGAIILSVSGAEALFADLGHFGRRPIVLAWYCIVLPSLMLNYLGQGGLVLDNPAMVSGPFFGLVPHWALYPMVALSTAATVIASQALISGAFSLTQQAINMGFAPRYTVVHTAEDSPGQIYIPVVNYLLMIGCVALILGFRSSDALGSAYGLAVIGTMAITSITYFVVVRTVWGWSWWRAVPLVGAFLVVDIAFLGANLAKLFSGAWVPLAIGLLVFGVLAIWTTGRRRFRSALEDWAMPVADFQKRMGGWSQRDEGTAVFLSANSDRVPLVGRHAWLRHHVTPERVLLLRVETTKEPHVAAERQLEIEEMGDGLYRGVARFGFMHPPDLATVLRNGLPFDWESAIFYITQPVEVKTRSVLVRAGYTIFRFLGRSGLTVVEYFQIPPEQVVSVGLQLQDQAAAQA